MKSILWNLRTLEIVRNFPEEARKEIGYLLYQLQVGTVLSMPHSKPMPGIAPGCYELRVRDQKGSFRVFYFLKSKDRIFVIHAFHKKTQKTPLHEVAVASKNLKEFIYEKK